MNPNMVGELAPNSSHLTRELIKYVTGRGYFRAVSYQNGDKMVTSPPSTIVELVKSAATILAVVKRFTADMGVVRALRSDNGAQHTNRSFVEYGDDVGIRQELTAPYTPQQNDPVESAFWTAYKAGHTERLGVWDIYPDIRLEDAKGSTDVATASSWMESLLWASERFNRSATAANDGWLSPMRSCMRTARRCHYLRFSSRPTTELPDNARLTPVPALIIS